MSFPTSNLRIGLEVEGVVKILSDIDLEAGTYNLVDTGGDVFPIKEGGAAKRRLSELEPDKYFLSLPAE